MIDLINARKRYDKQKHQCNYKTDANKQPVQMKMNFAEWFLVWHCSGKWDLRGNRGGMYVMARHNDIGHYEIGNVSIIPFEQNIIEGHIGKKRSTLTKEKISKTKSGKKRSQSVCRNISEHQSGPGNSMYGKNHTDETKQKMRDSISKRSLLICPHCNKTSKSPANMNRWHFDNCKGKE